MHELMFQAGVKGMSERSELIPCTSITIYKNLKRKQGWSLRKHTKKGSKNSNEGQRPSLLLFSSVFNKKKYAINFVTKFGSHVNEGRNPDFIYI